MTREEAIRELKADYCGNRIICELYPDQCNREDCEIWLAIKALETQPDGDCISRRVAVDESRYCDPFGNPIYVGMRIGGNDVTLKAYDIVKAVEGVVMEGRVTRFPEDQTSVACVKPTKPDKETVDKLLYNIYSQLPASTGTGAMVSRKYWIEQLYAEIYGEGEKPKWMT